jgi:hypothetical protein
MIARAGVSPACIHLGWGARGLLLCHRHPFSRELTGEIQIGYYGRPLDPNVREIPNIDCSDRLSLLSDLFDCRLGSTLARAPRWRRLLVVTATIMILALRNFP